MKIIVLDLDMTLVDTLERFFIVYNRTREIFGLKGISREDFIDYFRKDMLSQIIPENVDKVKFWRTFRTLYGTLFTEKDKPMKGALNVLKWLKENNYKIIVTTGREVDPEKIWAELRKYSIAKYIDEVYTIKQQKPEEEDILFSRKGLLNRIIEKHNVKPSEVVFVGDYWVDMEAGKAVGTINIAVLTGLKDAKLLEKHGAHVVIEGIWELPKVLTSLLQKNIAKEKRNKQPKKEK